MIQNKSNILNPNYKKGYKMIDSQNHPLLSKLLSELVNTDVGDKIVLLSLKESLRMKMEMSQELEERDDLEDFEKQDLEDQKKMITHLEAVIDYYGG